MNIITESRKIRIECLIERARKCARHAFVHAYEKEKLAKRKNVSIVIVNYNTLLLTACLIYSIYKKINYNDGRLKIVLVDNCSFDGSREFLEILNKHGYIELVSLKKTMQHGPALRIGIKRIGAFEKNVHMEQKTGTVLILDSDVIVLRGDVLNDSIKALYSEGDVAMVAQLQNDSLADEGGYPHPSCLLLNKDIYELPKTKPFVSGGTPAIELAISVRRNGKKILNFLFRTDSYILHIGRGSLRKVYEYGLKSNPSYNWASTHAEPHYHGNEAGKEILEREHLMFMRDIKSLEFPYSNYLGVLEKFNKK